MVFGLWSERTVTLRACLREFLNRSWEGVLARKPLVGIAIILALVMIIPVLALWQQNPLWQYTTNGTTNAVAISSDGSYLATGVQTGQNSGRILLFNRAGTLLWSRTVDRAISSISLSNNGSYIAASGFQLVGTAPAAVIYENGAVYYFSRDGTQLWNYTTPFDQLNGDRPPIFGLQLSSDGSRTIAETPSSILCFDYRGQILWNYNSTTRGLIHMAASSNASYVALFDTQLRLLNGQGKTLWNYSGVLNLVQSLVITPDARYVAVGTAIDGTHGSLYLFNNTGNVLWSRSADSNPLPIAFSGDENTIVIGTNYHIIAYSIQGSQLWSYSAPPANALAVTSDGSYTLAGLWADWQQSILILNSQGHVVWGKPAGEIHDVVISSDGSYAAVAAGPSDTGPFSFNSAAVYFIPSPRAVVTNTGSIYSLLYFTSTLDIIPTASIFLVIPVAYPVIIITRKRLRIRREQEGSAKDTNRQDPESQ